MNLLLIYSIHFSEMRFIFRRTTYTYMLYTYREHIAPANEREKFERHFNVDRNEILITFCLAYEADGFEFKLIKPIYMRWFEVRNR